MSRAILAAGSARVSEMVATPPSYLQRPFRQAKALYRFLANPRAGADMKSSCFLPLSRGS